MLARVKVNLGYPVTAFGGRAEFVASEFRPVPAGYEAEAEAHPFLEVIEEIAPEPEPEPEMAALEADSAGDLAKVMAEIEAELIAEGKLTEPVVQEEIAPEPEPKKKGKAQP